ncbi:MAG: hypothetical protein KKD05_05340 [Candidatus Omnitrophica bacterium]|nr:hypothetical protein [Candidatus Omnitrophota bacterium]
MRHFKQIFETIPIIAFFETSFFAGLPDEEKYIDVCCAQIMKHIGGGVASLGGLDNMIFS